MNGRVLYSIKEARQLLGGISRNSIYALLRTGDLPSVKQGIVVLARLGRLLAQTARRAGEEGALPPDGAAPPRS